MAAQKKGGALVNVLGTVQRMKWEGEGLPFIEHRTRDLGAMFAEAEWSWSRDSDEAFVFPMFARPAVLREDDYSRSAEYHVEALKLAGEPCRVWACVFGAQAAQARAERAGAAVVTTMRSARVDEDLTVAEPGCARGSRPPVRQGDKIQERIHKARGRNTGNRPPIDPAIVFEREEKRHLA